MTFIPIIFNVDRQCQSHYLPLNYHRSPTPITY